MNFTNKKKEEEKVVTSKEMKEEIHMTEKQPRKESATTAPKIGKIVLHPLAMLYTLAALTLFMLNSSIKYTIKLLFHPAAANDNPAILPNQISTPPSARRIRIFTIHIIIMI